MSENISEMSEKTESTESRDDLVVLEPEVAGNWIAPRDGQAAPAKRWVVAKGHEDDFEEITDEQKLEREEKEETLSAGQ